jgi:hypothetical protein
VIAAVGVPLPWRQYGYQLMRATRADKWTSDGFVCASATLTLKQLLCPDDDENLPMDSGQHSQQGFEGRYLISMTILAESFFLSSRPRSLPL